MPKKTVAITVTLLSLVLSVLAYVLTDFHDREFPQQLGVRSTLDLDFERATLADDQAFAELAQLDARHGLGAYKLVPDLETPGRQLFVPLGAVAARHFPEGDIMRFGAGIAPSVVSGDRLAHAVPDGAYPVTDTRNLTAAIRDLEAHGVAVTRTDATVLTTFFLLTVEAGFLAPCLAVCGLVAAITVFWLAIRARSRALRVLAGGRPWRIHVQDLGWFIAALSGSALAVLVVASGVVGVARGWVFVPAYAQFLAGLQAASIATSVGVALLLSATVWPRPSAIARRIPPVRPLRHGAWAVQIVTFALLLIFAGPTVLAFQQVDHTAKQLTAWNAIAGRVKLSFAFLDPEFEKILPRVAAFVRQSDQEDRAALSYALRAEDWQGEFGEFSTVAFVNQKWLDLVGATPASGALQPVAQPAVEAAIGAALAPSLELWSHGETAGAVLQRLTAFRPAADAAVPVMLGGGNGELLFPRDALILVAEQISDVFGDRAMSDISTTANIIFDSVAEAQVLLRDTGLDRPGLAESGAEGSLDLRFVAEQGQLHAQYQQYLAILLALAIFAISVAFVVSAGLHATISAILQVKRDFPLRLSGASWWRVLRGRFARDAIAAAALTVVVWLAQPPEARVTVTLAALFTVGCLAVGHLIATSQLFRRASQRQV